VQIAFGDFGNPKHVMRNQEAWEIVGSGFTSSQIIEEVTEIKMDEIKGKREYKV